MASPTTTPLSKNDQLVLSALFDAESTPTKPTITPSTTKSSHISSPPSQLAALQAQESAAILPLNAASPPQDAILAALRTLSTLIAAHPTYASAYANRAQALRLLHGADPTVHSTLYADLCAAIALGNDGAADNSGSVLAAAHTHRAHVLLQASKAVREAPAMGAALLFLSLPEEMRGLDAEALERLAHADFEVGGRYGNAGARQMAVKMNPYAKLCGEIVREAMQRDLREAMEGREGM